MGDPSAPSVPSPDADARRATAERLATWTAFSSVVGKLSEPACWLAATQGIYPPHPPVRPRVVVVAADHGIAAAGVSANQPGTSHRQVAAIRDGTAALAVLAHAVGASVRVVDVGLDSNLIDGAESRYRVRRSSGRIDREDALTSEEAERAIAIGRQLTDDEVDSGADLLIPAAVGVGATTPATVLVSAATGVEPVAVVGRGSGIDDAGWMRKTAAVRDARRRARPYAHDPMRLLTTAGGADLAVLTGMCLQAAQRRTPVLLSGPVVTSAALIAERITQGSKDWWLLADIGPEPVEAKVAEHLGLQPLLNLGVGLGDGTAAVLALSLLRSVAQLLTEATPVGDATSAQN